MPTLAVRFPARRYHATPWGHHVNEGLIEWPPSPWRLLRALLATGYTKLGWRDVPPLAVSLIEKLAAIPPRFQLPAATTAHSRHYMPAPVKTTLVFDTWARVEEGELLIDWPAELDSDESGLLEKLVSCLSYLGRSESWVEARLVAQRVERPNAYASEGAPNPGPGWEQVSLLATEPAASYATWRNAQLERVRAEHQRREKPPGSRATPKALKKAEEARLRLEAPFPADLIACLGVDTSWLETHGWSQPPGSRRVLYWRRADALEVGPPPRSTRPSSLASVECALLALATPSRRKGALPPIVRTFPQARLIHRAVAKRAGDIDAETRLAVLGCAATGEHATANHRHAHILPLDLDGDQRLDHVLVWAPCLLNADAQRIIASLRETHSRREEDRLQLTVIAEGSTRDLLSLGEPGRPPRTILEKVVGGENAKTWTSATPFFPARYVKKRGRNTLEGQLHAEVEARGHPKLERIEYLTKEVVVGRRFLHFVRHDSRHHPKEDVPFALRLHFAEAVQGPLCLGYGSHYGLGRFESEA